MSRITQHQPAFLYLVTKTKQRAFPKLWNLALTVAICTDVSRRLCLDNPIRANAIIRSSITNLPLSIDGINTKIVFLGTPNKIQGWEVPRDFDINKKFRILLEFVTANFRSRGTIEVCRLPHWNRVHPTILSRIDKNKVISLSVGHSIPRLYRRSFPHTVSFQIILSRHLFRQLRGSSMFRSGKTSRRECKDGRRKRTASRATDGETVKEGEQSRLYRLVRHIEAGERPHPVNRGCLCPTVRNSRGVAAIRRPRQGNARGNRYRENYESSTAARIVCD